MNKPIPKVYRTTNWSSYNKALINRGNISIWFDPTTQWYAQPQGKHGRNQTYSDAMIVIIAYQNGLNIIEAVPLEYYIAL